MYTGELKNLGKNGERVGRGVCTRHFSFRGGRRFLTT